MYDTPGNKWNVPEGLSTLLHDTLNYCVQLSIHQVVVQPHNAKLDVSTHMDCDRKDRKIKNVLGNNRLMNVTAANDSLR